MKIESTVIVNEKFDDNNIITRATLRLIIKLSSNILSSDITNHILVYLRDINHSYQYINFKEDIEIMLENQGWHKDKGFMRQPNKDELIRDLNIIIDRYIK
jgi:hypothetical protein